MRKQGNASIVALTLLLCACGRAADTAPSAEPAPAQRDEPAVEEPVADEGGMSPRLRAVYESLNMRSFPSSFGPRLKHFCESYPFEYFPESGVSVDSANKMTLVNGDDTWVIELAGDNRARIEMSISGPGSYYALEEYAFEVSGVAADLRADAAWIEQRPGCKRLNAGVATAMGQYDLRGSRAQQGWLCGGYWSGRTATPELDYWQTLEKLPHELNRANPDWGDVELLRVNVIDHQSMTGRCGQGEQLRDVWVFPVFDRPGGAEVGRFVRIWTYAHEQIDMSGYVVFEGHGAHKVNFGFIDREQLVLGVTGKDGDWINLSTTHDAPAWFDLSKFEPHVFSTRSLSP